MRAQRSAGVALDRCCFVAAFELAEPATARLAVFDVGGREVAVLKDGAMLPAGLHELPLDVQGMASGLYVVRLQVGSAVATRTLTVVR